jgi:hypothetical protein
MAKSIQAPITQRFHHDLLESKFGNTTSAPDYQINTSTKRRYRSQEAMTTWFEESKKEAVWNHLAVLHNLDHSPPRRKL